jgi:hypothetical protein
MKFYGNRWPRQGFISVNPARKSINSGRLHGERGGRPAVRPTEENTGG